MANAALASACVSRSDPMVRQLNGSDRRLVELLQSVHFGRLHDLAVRDGEPVFNPSPRVIRTFKLSRASGTCNAARSQARAHDFALKSEVVELLAQIRRLGDGVITRIDVAHGLPVSMEVEDGGPR